MTGSKYKDIDVPFCCECSRFMVKYIGEVEVALNHYNDEKFEVRTGKAYKCPECGRRIIYEWTRYENKIPAKKFKTGGNWKIFLEDHKHWCRGRAKK